MPTDGSRESDPDPWMRFAKGTVPLAIVALLLFLRTKGPDPLTGIILTVLGALVLWLGWNSVRESRGTRWFGILLALYVGAVLGVFLLALLLAVVVRIAFVLFLLLLVIAPYWPTICCFVRRSKAASSGPAPNAAICVNSRVHRGSSAKQRDAAAGFAPT